MGASMFLNIDKMQIYQRHYALGLILSPGTTI